MKLIDLLESTNGHMILTLEKGYVESFLKSIDSILIWMQQQVKNDPDFLKSYVWPKSYEESVDFRSLLNPIEATFHNALTGVVNEDLLQQFKIKKPVVFVKDTKLVANSDGVSAMLDVSSNQFKLYYPPKVFEQLLKKFKKQLLELKKPNKSTIKKWCDEVRGIAKGIAPEIKKDAMMKRFMVTLLHELTHATQASATNIDQLETVNAFGKKFRDVLVQKMNRGIYDRDYYSLYDEVDAYANELSAKLIQQADGERIDVATLEKEITHPVYDNFGKMSREPDQKEEVYKKVWRKFVKRVVQNINVYNDKIFQTK